ncbi:MAG: hypothetical protein JST35_12720 [Armatimonadetes bacterium]|nr:hypothetical protein [Armatimonadota bacterium]
MEKLVRQEDYFFEPLEPATNGAEATAVTVQSFAVVEVEEPVQAEETEIPSPRFESTEEPETAQAVVEAPLPMVHPRREVITRPKTSAAPLFAVLGMVIGAGGMVAYNQFNKPDLNNVEWKAAPVPTNSISLDASTATTAKLDGPGSLLLGAAPLGDSKPTTPTPTTPNSAKPATPVSNDREVTLPGRSHKVRLAPPSENGRFRMGGSLPGAGEGEVPPALPMVGQIPGTEGLTVNGATDSGSVVTMNLEMGEVDADALQKRMAKIAKENGGDVTTYTDISTNKPVTEVRVPQEKEAKVLGEIKKLGSNGGTLKGQIRSSGTDVIRSENEAGRERLNQLAAQRRKLLEKYLDDAPEIKDLDAQIEQVKKQMRSSKPTKKGKSSVRVKFDRG